MIMLQQDLSIVKPSQDRSIDRGHACVFFFFFNQFMQLVMRRSIFVAILHAYVYTPALIKMIMSSVDQIASRVLYPCAHSGIVTRAGGWMQKCDSGCLTQTEDQIQEGRTKRKSASRSANHLQMSSRLEADKNTKPCSKTGALTRSLTRAIGLSSSS